MKLFITTIIVLLFSFLNNVSFSQWTHVNSQSFNTINKVEVNENFGICIATGVNFLKSINNGVTWTISNSSNNYFTNIFDVTGAVIISPTNYVLAHNINNTGCKISRTTDGGASWTMTSSVLNIRYTDLAYNGNSLIVVGSSGMIKRSTDNGLSWSSVSSGTTNYLRTVEWDANQNMWFIGGSNIKLSSSDGINWTSTTLNYSINDISFHTNKLVETRIFSNYSSVVVFDNNNTVVHETFSDTYNFLRSMYLSNDKIMTHNSASFWEIQTQNNFNTYQLTDVFYNNNNSGSGTTINDFDFGTTYGIAVGVNGGLARYLINSSPTLISPSNFAINSVQNCPNAPFIATPEFTGADLYQWYIDNVLISNDDTLFYNQPTTPGSHTLKLITTYQTHTSVFSSFIQTNYPPAVPIMTIYTDTTICYNDQVKFFIDVTPTTFNTLSVNVLQNGNIVTGPTVIPNSNQFTLNSINLTNSDSLQILFTAFDECDTVFMTYSYFFHVTENLNLYSLAQADSGICNLVNPLDFSISNSIDGASYSFKYINYTSTYPTNITATSFNTTIGNGIDTINVSLPATSVNTVSYYDEIYEDTNKHHVILISVSFQNCTVNNIPLFEFDATNTDAQFAFFQHSTLIGDTIKIANMHKCDGYSWSITPNTIIATNLTSEVPLFIADSIGEYTVQLINESRLGCVDTLTRTQIIADQLPADTSHLLCYESEFTIAFYNNNPNRTYVLGSKVSKNGNYYEFGYAPYCCPNFTDFSLRKLNANGDVMWVKSLNYHENTYLITAMDIDENENIYATLYVDGSINYGLLNYDYYANLTNSTRFIVQWDSLGNMIKMKQMGYSITTGLLFDDNKIHLSSTEGVMTLDTDFNLIHSSNISGYYPGTNAPYYGSAPNVLSDGRWKPGYPFIKMLPNGNVLVTGAFSPSTTGSYTQLSLDNIVLTGDPNSSNFIYTAIYNPVTGFISASKIMESTGANSTVSCKDVCVDKESNIYLLTNAPAYSWEQPSFKPKMYLLDSLIEISTGYGLNKSFLLKLNSDFDLLWAKESSIMASSLKKGLETDELVITGSIFSDIYFGSGNDFYRLEAINPCGTFGPPAQLGNFIVSEAICLFVDTDGNPNKAVTFGKENVSTSTCLISAVSTCGDVYLSGLTSTSSPYELLNTTYNLNSNYVFKLSENNCIDNCPFLNIENLNYLPYCSVDTNFSIALSSVNNIDFVGYSVLQNGTEISTGTYSISGNEILAHIPQGNTDYNVVLFNPADFSVYDTIAVNLSFQNNQILDTNFYFMNCDRNLTLTVDPSVFHNITWNFNCSGVTTINSVNTLNFSSISSFNNLQQDSLYTFNITALDSNNCPSVENYQINYCTDSMTLETTKFNSYSNNVTIFPNPASDEINISMDHYSANSIMTIYNLNGANLKSIHFNEGNKFIISIDDLSDGYYILKVVTDSEAIKYIHFVKN